MSLATRPCDNPFNAQRIDALPYIEAEESLADVAARLKQRRYRGALLGPHGCGKSAMLHALGDELMKDGLSPLPLFLNADRPRRWAQPLPMNWRRTIRQARATDALLLDGYDLLPWWVRLWVCVVSRRAGAVVVTTHRRVWFKTVAEPKPTRVLLRQLVHRLSPQAIDTVDVDALFDEAKGNLRDALRLAYDLNRARSVSE